MLNLCEHIRKQAIQNLFTMKTMQVVWPIWQKKITELLPKPYTASDVIGLGDHLAEIFKTTGTKGRDKGGQGGLSSAGIAWEGLVCWYMNLCLVGSRAVVLRPALVPTPLSHALTVKYNNSKSNSESDLIGITFPNKEEVTRDLNELQNFKSKTGVHAFVQDKFNYKPFIDDLTDLYFSEIEALVIQCKTNWNDNAQIPMLWDMIYRAKEFTEAGIVVGHQNYSIRTLKSFKYSFATVPSVKKELKADAIAVRRVRHISGGNYWGRPSKDSVALSMAEIFGRNFYSASSSGSLRTDLTAELKNFDEKYDYFRLKD